MIQLAALRPGDVETFAIDIASEWLADGDTVDTVASVFSTDEPETGIQILLQNWAETNTVNKFKVSAVAARAADYEIKLRMKTGLRDRTYIINLPVRESAG